MNHFAIKNCLAELLLDSEAALRAPPNYPKSSSVDRVISHI
jgi:hypothetical protein